MPPPDGGATASGGDRQGLSFRARLIVMDEPSATLTTTEVERLFGVIRELKAQGLGVIYISHRLEEIFNIADTVTVLRDGQHVATCPVAEVTREKLIEQMVGRKLDQEFPRRQVTPGPTRLVVQHLCRGQKVQDVSFAIRAGEVLGSPAWSAPDERKRPGCSLARTGPIPVRLNWMAGDFACAVRATPSGQASDC